MQDCHLLFVNTLTSESVSKSQPQIHSGLAFSLVIFAFFWRCASCRLAPGCDLNMRPQRHLSTVEIHTLLNVLNTEDKKNQGGGQSLCSYIHRHTLLVGQK